MGMADIINIFNFLKEFNELSNPVITEIDNQKWSLSISDIPLIDEIRSVFLGHEVCEMDYLEIKRPTLLPCPIPQESLIEWIKSDWKKLSVDKIEVTDKLLRVSLDDNGNMVYKDELFIDDEARVDAYALWLSSRNSWRDIEVPKSKGLDLYNKLFQLYSEMKLESESVELMLGDGNIRWYTSERVIDHPVLLQKVFLDFDAHVPSFRVYCEENKSEIYTPMLRIIPSINQKMLSDIIMEIDDGEYDLAQVENTSALFIRIINVVDIKGTFVEQPKSINETATIHSAPILFLRKRNLGFSSFIEGVIEDIQTNSEIELPEFFEIMSGIYAERPQEEIVEKSWNHSGIDEEVLLTLPANNEQLRIIKYLDRYGAVLVQGPPGTGKTHTIANLIGHLLSQGNSVLVTSHTEKALTVLKEKVYRDPHDSELNLQNLCISILSSTSQKKEMDEAINEIATKSSSINLNSSLRKIKRLEEERKEFINQSKKLSEEFVRARSMEYTDLIFDNHSITPIDAAKFLNSGKDVFDFISGKSNNDEVGFPLTHEELVFLYSSNDRLSGEEENLLRKAYPSSDQIISNADFAAKVNHINELRENLAGNAVFEDFEFTVDIDSVNQLLEESSKLISRISGFEPLERAIINQTIFDPTYPKLWDDVLKKIGIIQTKYESYRKLKLNNDLSIDESMLNKKALQILQNIVDSGKEKPIGLLANAEWKRIRNAIRVDGKIIKSREEFIKAYELVSYEIEKQEIIKIIGKLLLDIQNIDKPSFDDFENKIRRYKDQIITALSWYYKDCEAYLVSVEESIQWVKENRLPRVSSIDNLDSALSYLKSAQILLQAKKYEDDLQKINLEIEDYMGLLSGYTDSNPYFEALFTAVHELDKNKYVEHLKALNALIEKNEIAEKRMQLLSRIREIAPTIAKKIENREGIYSQSTIPDHFDEAWKHFQLRNQIERLDALDPSKVQSEIEQINTKLLKNARTLAFEKAWYEKIKNQTDKQNQALQGWRNTIKQIGKGTGKNAPMLKAKARELIPLCQMAIPIWIMPLNRVVETFDPRNNKFDVIIIDEASQANILSLAALYLAKKVIIVGDDEQVSPDSVGVNMDEVNALVAQHLEHIPNNHLYNGLTSLYDMAKSSGFKPLMLTEHFRCLPEIIGFSNDLSYNGRIKPLRDSSNASIYPPVVEYRVSGASRNNKKVNEVEADHIVSLIQAFLEMDEYKGQTIGVISMLGNEQSAAIEKKLQAVVDPIVYEDRRIQSGTPPQFQGDERDIIMLSLVDSPNENGGPLRLLSEDGNNDKYRKRYNVAVSRARNQLWVVHSLNPDIDLKPDDLRLKLIKYSITPNRDQDNLLSMSESPFETEVMKFLLAERYKVIPQFKVGAYKIDMLIQYGDKKIALECDGERFHTSENLNNDLARQAILERLGWRFIRIRGSEYYRCPEQTMKKVLDSLLKYGILPSYEDVESDKQAKDALLCAVKIKASAYRNNVFEPIDPNKGSEMVESRPIVDQKNQLKVVPGAYKVTSEYSEDGAVDAENTDGKEEKVAEPLVMAKHSFVEDEKDEVERKTEKIEVAPTFDFRGKQKAMNQKKEKQKAVEVTKTKATDLDKPKFDFRNRRP